MQFAAKKDLKKMIVELGFDQSIAQSVIVDNTDRQGVATLKAGNNKVVSYQRADPLVVSKEQQMIDCFNEISEMYLSGRNWKKWMQAKRRMFKQPRKNVISNAEVVEFKNSLVRGFFQEHYFFKIGST